MSVVDLRSDTVTRPGPAMRQAIAQAVVGDDVLGDDPTVHRLEEMVARLLGKEAGLFFPSGTQANQAAIGVHAGPPGSEILLEEGSHVFLYENAGAAVFSGAQLRPLRGVNGFLSVAQLEAALRPDDPHFPHTRLVCLENTHNEAGGRILPIEGMESVAAFCRRHGLALHLDGARLMNAAVASGIPAARYAATADSVSLCLSKGLGAPVGTCLAASFAFIREARRWRKRLGGGMRQAGILAAAGIYALEHHVDRLAEDHRNARRLAEGIAGLPGLRVDPGAVETNIVLIDIEEGGPTADQLLETLSGENVHLLANGPRRLRAVTHLDVDAAGCRQALAVIGGALAD